MNTFERTWLFMLVITLMLSSSVGSLAQTALSGVSEEEEADWLDDDPQLAPFVTTPMPVVNAMLNLAGVTKDDLVYDLGSGDGRIVITAAKEYGARAVGFEIDPELVEESRINIQKARVDHLAEIRQEDFVKIDFAPATVITMYLLQESNLFLRPILRSDLRPGARIVSHRFDMDDWEQDDDRVIVDGNGERYTIYLWRITKTNAPVADNPTTDKKD